MSEWQPIETAPRDGKECIIFSAAEGGHFIAWFSSIAKQWMWTAHDIGDDRYVDHPTHWMPLPEPPTC